LSHRIKTSEVANIFLTSHPLKPQKKKKKKKKKKEEPFKKIIKRKILKLGDTNDSMKEEERC